MYSMLTLPIITLHTLLLLLLLTPSQCQSGSKENTNNRTCVNSFSFLEDDLLSREENRYNLLQAYYPPRGALPVFVTVTYSFDVFQNQSVWYWSESEFYLIQPIEVLVFTSLFHSNFAYRQRSVELTLSPDCVEAGAEFMETLTQRLKLYAQTSRVSVTSDPPRISDTYTAVAASQDEIQSDQFQSLFVQIWLHIVFILFPIATVILVYTCDPVQLLLGDKTWQKLRDESNHPRVAAMIQISVVFTIYVFVLDCLAFNATLSSDNYSGSSHAGFYLTTVTGFIVDIVAFLWVIFTLVSCCHLDCRNILKKEFGKPVPYGRIRNLLIITASPLLCGANHIPYVIFSFISDPYHAGSIAMGYFMSFLLFYFVHQQVYSRVALKTTSRPKNFPYATDADLIHLPDGDACRRKGHVPFNTQVLLLSMVVVSPLLVLYESILIILLQALPIRKTLEDAPTRLYTIYQGTGILIVALLTYNIVLSPSPFSLIGALDKLGKQLKIPEKLGRKWVRMGDEEKAATVIKHLYEMGSSESKVEEGGTNVTPNTSLAREGGAHLRGYKSVAMEDLDGNGMAARDKDRETMDEITLQMESTI